MAKHEYFIDDNSEAKSNAEHATPVEATAIPPVFELEIGTVIHVTNANIHHEERKFCYYALLDDETTTHILIEDGTRFLTSDLHGIVFRDNMFPVALTWKTRTGDWNTICAIFYDDNALFKFTGISWEPLGPSATIDISGSADHNGASYFVSYNHFKLNEPYSCRKHENIMLYLEDFGISWLANTLDYRASVIEDKN